MTCMFLFPFVTLNVLTTDLTFVSPKAVFYDFMFCMPLDVLSIVFLFLTTLVVVIYVVVMLYYVLTCLIKWWQMFTSFWWWSFFTWDFFFKMSLIFAALWWWSFNFLNALLMLTCWCLLILNVFSNVILFCSSLMVVFYNLRCYIHKKKSWVFPLLKSTMFLMKWDKVHKYATYMVLVKKD